MADLEGIPQWKRDLIRRRRATHQQSQSRRGQADMLLQSPASYDLSDPTDCSEDGSVTERSTPLRDTDTHTDSGEELTYGPGIVKKLKSRYLSLTLREANKSRPSIHGLRRATSLEHVLEDEKPAPPPRKYQPTSATTTTRQTRYRQPTRTPDAVRRARSVDALARCDSRSESEDLLSPVGRESPTTRETPQPPPLPSPTLRPKRPTPLLKDTERPPPDLVKQALKIFEGQPGKKLRTPSTGQVADKVKSFTETQKQAKITNGARLPRPAIPPRGPLLSPEHKHIPVATQTTPSLHSRPPPSPKKFINHKDDRERSISPVYVNKHPVILAPVDTSPVKSDFPVLRGVKTLDLKSPDVSPRNSLLKSPDLVSPREKSLREICQRNGTDKKEPYVRTSTPDPEIFTQPTTTEISLIAPTTPRNRDISESSSEDDAVFETNEGEPPKIKTVDRSALEGISNAGTTTQSSFNSSGVNGMNGDVKKSYLPSAKQSNIINNKSESVLINSNNNSSVNSGNNNKSKVPDLIQISNNNNSAALSARALTVADVKLITPVTSLIIPKCTNSSNNTGEDSNVLISAVVPLKSPSEVVTACPTTPINESNRLAAANVRQAKDIESSPALVHYNSPSPPPSQQLYNNKQLTTREIEKNLINTSKSKQQQQEPNNIQEVSTETTVKPVPDHGVKILDTVSKSSIPDPPVNNNVKTSVVLDQPVKKVTVSMLEGPDKTKVNNKIKTVTDSHTTAVLSEYDDGVIVKEIATTSSVVSVVENLNGDVVISKETKSVMVSDGASGVVSGGSASNGSVVVNNKLGSGRKPQWHQQETTTMLFDFSKRKGVPDYIENDGIIRRNRSKPKVGAGMISIDGLSGESCTDGASDSDDDWARRPPSPCDVAFENDNVVINGRSNISAGKPRARHLKIQFDESLTTTFEYPSEASLGEEHFAGTNASSSPASPIATGGPLSSYTPSKVTLQADTFQLGVTRSHHAPNTEMNANGSSTASTNGDISDAAESSTSNGTSNSSDEQPHNWSHETHIGAGDLLF